MPYKNYCLFQFEKFTERAIRHIHVDIWIAVIALVDLSLKVALATKARYRHKVAENSNEKREEDR